MSDEKDYGIPLLSFAFLTWGGISGLKHSWMQITTEESVGFASVLSIFNSILFLASFPFFEHGFKALRKGRNRIIWYLMLIFLFILSVVIALFLFARYEDPKIGYTIDLIISGLTSIGLGILLYNTFRIRKLYAIGIVAIFVIALMFLAQIAIVWGNVDYVMQYIDESIYVASFAVFALILVSLAFSWINEKSQRLFIDRAGLFYSNAFTVENDEKQKAIGRKEIPVSKLVHDFKNQLANDKTEEVIEELMTYYQSIDKNNKIYDLILIAARFTRSVTSNSRGIISNEEYGKERNTINGIILNMITELE